MASGVKKGVGGGVGGVLSYFTRHRTAANLLLVILKNSLGLVLALLGVVMLFTPGQGLLTLLAGLALMNFPGKYRLERRLALSPGVLKGINWMRERRNYPPMEAPTDPAAGRDSSR